jgi:hypothetical protein
MRVLRPRPSSWPSYWVTVPLAGDQAESVQISHDKADGSERAGQHREGEPKASWAEALDGDRPGGLGQQLQELGVQVPALGAQHPAQLGGHGQPAGGRERLADLLHSEPA